MGAARSRLVALRARGAAPGCAPRVLGRDAVACRPGLPRASAATPRRAFWGEGDRGDSMLHQIASAAGEAHDAARRSTPSSSARARTGWPPPSASPRAAGRSLVLEAATRPGGAVATEELTLPGFHHDVFSVRLPRRRGVARVRADAARGHGLALGPPRAARSAHPLPDGAAAIALTATSRRPPRRLDAVRPGDGAALARARRPVLEHFERGARDDALRLPAAARARSRLLAALGLRRHAGLRPAPARARRAGSAGRLFASDGARAWLYGAAMHGDVPPDGRRHRRSPAFYLKLLGHAVGWPSPEGGAGAAGRRARRACCASLGGEVGTGARVERVLTERDRVSGVRMAGGDVVRARIVVCRHHAARAARARARTRCRTPTSAGCLRASATGRDRQGRLGARRPRPVDAPSSPDRRDRPRRRHARARSPRRSTAAEAGRLPEQPVPAARAAVGRRPDPRARRQAHRVGLHPRPARRGLGAGARAVHVGASRRRSSASRPASGT